MLNLKIIRKANNLTQEELSKKSGVNLRSVQNYEQGYKDINAARAIVVYQLAKALNCQMDDLLELKKIEVEE